MHQEQSDTEFLASCFDPEDAEEDNQIALTFEQAIAYKLSNVMNSAVFLICKLADCSEEEAASKIGEFASLRANLFSYEQQAELANQALARERKNYQEYIDRANKTPEQNVQELKELYPNTAKVLSEFFSEETDT